MAYELETRTVWSSMRQSIELANSLNVMASQAPTARVPEFQTEGAAERPTDRWRNVEGVLKQYYSVGLSFIYKPAGARNAISIENAYGIVTKLSRTVRLAFTELQELRRLNNLKPTTSASAPDDVDFGGSDSGSESRTAQADPRSLHVAEGDEAKAAEIKNSSERLLDRLIEIQNWIVEIEQPWPFVKLAERRDHYKP